MEDNIVMEVWTVTYYNKKLNQKHLMGIFTAQELAEAWVKDTTESDAAYDSENEQYIVAWNYVIGYK